MKNIIATTLLALWLASTSHAQDAPKPATHPPIAQKWEYRLLDADAEGTATAKQAGLAPEQLVAGEKAVSKFMEARLARLNALGEEGWEFCGCLDKENSTMVFRRPK